MDTLETIASSGEAGSGRDEQLRVNAVRLARTIRWMLERLDGPLGGDEAARIACLSRYHFVRQFRALTGLSPERFHLRLRMQRAAWSLARGDGRVTEIALSAGFESVDGFTRAFHRIYGVSPSAFRRLGADPWAGLSRFGYWRPPAPMFPIKGGRRMLELKDMPAIVYAAARNLGPYNTVGPAFGRIVGWAASSGLMRPDTKVIGLAWDNPTVVPADKLRYDAAVTVPGRLDTPDDIKIGALPAMTWAMTTHRGSYARMTESFMQLGTEMGRRTDIVHVPMCSLEIYLSDPDKTPESDLLTEIGFPVVRVT
jgi:AraC family transcriptional regulator